MKNTVDKKIIGFDMDGVIIDHVSNKIRSAKKFGFKITKKQTPTEIIRTLIPQPEYGKFQTYLYNHPVNGLRPKPMPGVKKVLSVMKKSGVPFFLISRRKKHHISKILLKKNGLWPKYFNKDNTFFVDEIEDKEIKAKELGITHYIDDERKVLTALVSVKNKFLFDYLGAFPDSEYKRISSWKEIAKLI